jgi:excisionase family DNA binding protein
MYTCKKCGSTNCNELFTLTGYSEDIICHDCGHLEPPPGRVIFLTTAEAADALDLDRRTVIAYIHRGLIQANKFGRDWQIDPAEVERYQKERRKPGRPKATDDI